MILLRMHRLVPFASAQAVSDDMDSRTIKNPLHRGTNKEGICAEFWYLLTEIQVDNLEKSANLPNRAAM